jgi:hypothetical protein
LANCCFSARCASRPSGWRLEDTNLESWVQQ